jgi:hypothetical protein
MFKFIGPLVFSLFFLQAASQSFDLERFHLGLGTGLTNYYGDLEQSEILLRTKTFGVGGYASYNFFSNFNLRAGFNFGKVSAFDSKNKNPSYIKRNLSFYTNIQEVNLLLEFSIFNINRFNISPYVFGGIAGFHFNPYSYDMSNKKTYLQPLGTEGQNNPSISGKKPYSLFQLSLPFGGGIRYDISSLFIVGVEVGWRRLFTDYLDDVGGPYADPSSFTSSKSYEMAFRTPEIDPLEAYSTSLKRGDPSNNDWYAFYNLTLSMNFKNFKALVTGNKGDIKCPRF